MNDRDRGAMVGGLLSRLNLRFPGLFALLLVVTIADVLVPDFIPFVDEIVLALLTALLGLWKARRPEPPAAAPPALPPTSR